MRFIRRMLVGVVGGTVLVIGIAMIVLPVPSLVVILAGLGILALEFAWAKHWFVKVRQYMPGSKKEELSVAAPTPEESQAPEA